MSRIPYLLLAASALAAHAAFPTISERGFCTVASDSGVVEENFSTRSVEQLRIGDPEGARFLGTNDAALALYFSNGLGLSAKGVFAFSVETYRQTPFAPSYQDREFEPSRSELSLQLDNGVFGIWRTSPRATSDLLIKTSLAELRVESSACALWVSDDTLAICLKNGIAYLTIPETGFSETVQTGQYVVLKKSAFSKPFPLEVSQATIVEKTKLDALIELARWPYERIYFSKNKAGDVVPRVLLQKIHFKQRPVGDPNL